MVVRFDSRLFSTPTIIIVIIAIRAKESVKLCFPHSQTYSQTVTSDYFYCISYITVQHRYPVGLPQPNFTPLPPWLGTLRLNAL